MEKPKFVYVTYIRTTPEKLWEALIKPEFTRRYWFATSQVSEWKPGAPWKMVFEDGTIANTGEVIEIDPPRRLVLSWRKELKPELREEGYSRLTYEIEPMGARVKLTVLHEIDKPADKPVSKFIEAVSSGWPQVLSSLKSLLETGEPLDEGEPCSRRQSEAQPE